MADRPTEADRYTFEGGFPSPETIQTAYDDADLNRAVQAYRFFFPTVSGLAIFTGPQAVGLAANDVFGVLDTEPEQLGFTLNSDTPYGPVLLDLRAGPIVVEMPAGPLVCAFMDLNQRWVADMGIPGPDAGEGGSHLLLPPGWDGDVPDGFHVSRATSYRIIGGCRAIPVGGDVQAAKARLSTIKIRPLHPPDGWKEPSWKELTGTVFDTTPLARETTIDYWRALHEVIDTEPHLDAFGVLYGELAALGIAKGVPFAPDERMTRILEQAAEIGNAQMRVQSFADRRPDRVVWPATQWQWAALRSKTAISTRTATSTSTRARNGSSRQSPPHPPCSAAPPAPAPLLARPARQTRRLPRRQQGLHPGRTTTRSRQALLVDHRL